MTNPIQKDYIIVGQGLAGTVLAQTLLSRGKSVLIIDNENLSKASRVAAGLYNPVVFKRLVKSWLADELISFMDTFYGDAERLLGESFYFKKEIVRLFSEEQEKALWLKKTEEPVGVFLNKEIEYGYLSSVINNPLGSSFVLNSGNLNPKEFLDAFRNYFRQNNNLLNETFDIKELQIADDKVQYKNFEASKVIFCEGFKATENPFFSWLPFKLTKGETITIQLKEPCDDFKKVVNKSVFIMPVGNNTYRVGATYEWQELNEKTSEKGLLELTEKLDNVLQVPYEVIEHKAGIRPTVSDRRPLLGLHPKQKELGIFNGLGTKGVMLAPYFANHFADFLENNSTLNSEVNIERFVKKHYTS